MVLICEYYEYNIDEEGTKAGIWGDIYFMDCTFVSKMGENKYYFYGENDMNEPEMGEKKECKKGYFLYKKQTGEFITGLDESKLKFYLNNNLKLEDSKKFLVKKGIKKYW